MNKRAMMGCLLALTMLFTACNGQAGQDPAAPTQTPGAPSAPSVSQPESVPQPSEQPASSQPQPEPSAQPVEPQKVVYKEEEFFDWMPQQPDTEQNDACTALRRIHQVRYGEAGASLDMTGAAALMLKDLAEDPEFEKMLDVYLQDLTPLQRDYFSFQWQSVHGTALRMLQDPANYQSFLGDVGREDLDLASCDANRLAELDELVHTKLSSYGVCDSWKDYTDLEPFCLSAEA